jgi:hypothetical protein
MVTFLKNLIPQRLEWPIPCSLISKLSLSQLLELRWKFALKLNTKKNPTRKSTHHSILSPVNSDKNINIVWGFQGYLDQALLWMKGGGIDGVKVGSDGWINGVNGVNGVKGVKVDDKRLLGVKDKGSRSEGQKSSESDRDYSTISDDSNNSNDNNDIDDDNNDIDDDEDDGEILYKGKEDPSRGKKVYMDSFIFMDREVGMFYTTYETEFQKFLSQTYNVKIKKVEEVDSGAGVGGGHGSGGNVFRGIRSQINASNVSGTFKTL